jgi:hypothetical protein
MMPSKSKEQHNFMAAVANNPAFAKKTGVPQSVGKEFNQADKGRKFKEGGDMKNTSRMNKLEEMGRLNAEKAYTSKGKKNLAAEKQRVIGDLKGMKKGGIATSLKAHAAAPASKAHGMKKGGSVGTTKMGAVRTASPSRDGVATQGKTRGTPIKMARGGKTC